ncbi:MAG: TIGR03560 family F420-dependent LLM class oxidoreductase [Acidimicrobiales bacterium]|nr:TIGR03560 family F420-dependent LLM class oxidoreductase [Acidimicrobiales bacterium]
MGLQIPSFTYPGVPDAELFERVAAIAATAEQAGFDSVWVMDHFYQLPLLGRPEEPMLECYTLLSALAARTSTVRLGGLVTGVTYRNPALLAKEVTTLDVISSGRAILGIGAAWFEQEHDGYGFRFGTFTERFEKLDEALQIIRSMFVHETTSFSGEHFVVRDALNSPRPVTPGGPPVLIGGSGERKTLRMVARYGDACNVFGTPDQVRHLMGVLDGHCEAVGRDPATICRTRLGTLIAGRTQADAEARRDATLAERGITLAALPDDDRARVEGMFLVGGPDAVGEQVQALLDAGLDGLIVNLPDAHDLESVELAGEVLGTVLGG